MERCWLFKQLTLRNLLTSVCAILSALMILQELYNFMIVKPTTAAKEEKEMMFSDIPETVICANPGFYSAVLARYGYGNGFYHRGSMDGKHFVGWNGHKNESKSADSILEEALTVGKKIHSLFTAIDFSNDNERDRSQADTEFRTLSFPIGRCLVVNPPRTIPDICHFWYASCIIWTYKRCAKNCVNS